MPYYGDDYTPGAFVKGPFWRELLETAVRGPDRDNWLTWYHLGLVRMNAGADDALCALERAADFCANGPVLHALAEALASAGKVKEAAACAVKSCRLFGGDLSVAKETLFLLVSLRECELAMALIDDLPQTVQDDGRIEFLRASALVYLDRCDEALAILQRPGYIMADFREGEQGISVLWDEIIRRTGRDELSLPDQLNFTTHDRKDKK